MFMKKLSHSGLGDSSRELEVGHNLLASSFGDLQDCHQEYQLKYILTYSFNWESTWFQSHAGDGRIYLLVAVRLRAPAFASWSLKMTLSF